MKLAMLHSSFDARTMGYVRLTHIVRYVTRGTKVSSKNIAFILTAFSESDVTLFFLIFQKVKKLFEFDN